MIIAQLLVLILVANGAPILARNLFGNIGACPLDGGLRIRDGRALFGPHKTARGLIAALIATPAAGLVIGIAPPIALLVGIGAMAGDLVSSFIKRRLNIEPSGQAPGLDQIPESLLPLLLVADPMRLSATDITLAVVAFIVLEFALSRILFRLRIRKKPY